MSKQHIDITAINSDETHELSLKELIIKITKWAYYIRSRWVIILFVSSLGSISGFVYAFLKKPVYKAVLTFALEEEKQGGSSIVGALGIANSLGIDLAGGNAGSVFSGANLIELMKSRSLVEKTLLNPISEGHAQSLASYFIDFNDWRSSWEDSSLKRIYFQPFSDRSRFTIIQDSVLGLISRKIIGPSGLLTVSQKDKKVGIITIEMESENEFFSKRFVEMIAKVVSDFYISTRSKKAKANYDILLRQTDSVRTELYSAIMGVAVANDNTYNLNPALNVNRTPSTRKQIDVQSNIAVLTQLVTNLELAKVSLRKETPLIQIIDSPILPLEKNKPSKTKSIIIGGFLGMLLTIFFLLLIKTWRRIMYS